jgi:hypothetical protein
LLGSPVAVTTKIELSGNFFTHDPGKTLYANIGDMLDKLASEMEAEVAGDIAAHESQMPAYTGWSTAHVRGYTTSPRTGKHWALWAAVASVTQGMSRKDAIRTKAAAATIERRWHPYRRVKSAVYGSRALISADLAKNLD